MDIPTTDQEPGAEDILALQIEQIYRLLPVSLLVNAINGLVLVAILWGTLDARRLLIWLAVLSAVTAIRWSFLRAYRHLRRNGIPAGPLWGRYFLLGACASGLTWGAAGVALFHPASFPHQIFIAFALGGMMAGGIPFLSPLPGAYPCFALAVSLPILIEMLMQGDRIHLTMALMILIFWGAMLTSALQFQRVFRDSIRLQLRLSDSIAERRELAQLARLDELTGIPNRRFFDETLATEWKRAQRKGKRLSLIMADIDDFKPYNDQLGHIAGDVCLARVAATMASALRRPGDVAARIGGEEFAFLLPDTPGQDAAEIAERIRRDILALRIAHPASRVGGQVTISLGVATLIPTAERSPSDLVQAADVALYRAKDEGRNRVVSAF